MHHKPLHPPQPHENRRPHQTNLAASRLLGFVDTARLDQALSALVPDAVDRAFVLRCLVGVGPMHPNYILVTLLASLLPDATPLPEPDETAGVQVPMRLPTRALSELVHGNAQQLEATVDCLNDGPPQHALANVVMVSLVERLQRSVR